MHILTMNNVNYTRASVPLQAGADRASVKEYQRLVGCALELCKEGDAATAAQLQPLAVAAVTEFIKSPTMFQADWSSSPAVVALGKDSATKGLYDLFSAVLSGNLTSKLHSGYVVPSFCVTRV